MSGPIDQALTALMEAVVERRLGEPIRQIAAAVSALAGTRGESATAGIGPWNFRGHPDQSFGPTTYAQFGEDLILLNIFHLLGIERPSFIDVGAHHPVNISNTALLYQRGSRGINIEANPNLIAAFAELRPEDLTLNVGVGPASGVLDFYMIDDFSGRNTFDRETAERFVASDPRFTIREVRRIQVQTLDQIVAEYRAGQYPELLCIDAEGLDYAIAQAAHFGPEGPIVICTEVVSGANEDSSGQMTSLLQRRGYVPYLRTVGNIIFVRAAEAGRLAA